MFGKNKKITASDILKMIAELPEDEQASVKSMLNGDSEEIEEETVVEETAESEAETKTDTEEEPVEQEEEIAEETAEETADPQEDPPSDEPAEDPAPDVEEAGEETVEEVAEETAPETNARDIYAEFDALKEAFGALVQRIDALTAKTDGDPEAEIGMPLGPDSTEQAKEGAEARLERSRFRLFGF